MTTPPPGAVELPLKCAEDWDSESLGMEYWQGGAPEGDPRKEAYGLRTKCYDHALKALTSFDEGVEQATTEAAGMSMAVVRKLWFLDHCGFSPRKPMRPKPSGQLDTKSRSTQVMQSFTRTFMIGL
jgi:Non-repetitive/WGA-negative nucleoporin C-terminal